MGACMLLACHLQLLAHQSQNLIHVLLRRWGLLVRDAVPQVTTLHAVLPLRTVPVRLLRVSIQLCRFTPHADHKALPCLNLSLTSFATLRITPLLWLRQLLVLVYGKPPPFRSCADPDQRLPMLRVCILHTTTRSSLLSKCSVSQSFAKTGLRPPV